MAGSRSSVATLNSKQFLTSTSEEQIRQLIAYLRSLEPNAPSVPNWRQGKP
jgi:cytochrome c553